jgi:hypothetical protein
LSLAQAQRDEQRFIKYSEMPAAFLGQLAKTRDGRLTDTVQGRENASASN